MQIRVKVNFEVYLLYTGKMFGIFMYAQRGDNKVCNLAAPSKNFENAQKKNEIVVKIMPSEARLKIFGDNNIK